MVLAIMGEAVGAGMNSRRRAIRTSGSANLLQWRLACSCAVRPCYIAGGRRLVNLRAKGLTKRHVRPGWRIG